MNFLFDGRPLMEKKPTGVTFFTINLLKLLSRQALDHNFFVLTTGKKIYNPQELAKLPRVKFGHYQISNKRLKVSQFFHCGPKIEKLAKKVFPEVKMDRLILPNLNFFQTSLPYFVVFHDLSFHIVPDFFSFKSRLWHYLFNPRKIAQNAQKIWTVSQNTKNDLIHFYNLKDEKISVHYPNQKEFPTDNLFFNETKNKNILFVGTIEKRKNILNLVKVFNNFIKSFPKYKLILIGKPGFGSDEIFTATKNKPQIIYKNYLSEQELWAEFEKAEFFVFPSFYEGFGLPLVEAMSFGLPIIVASNSANCEVVNNAGMLYNVFDNKQLLESLKAMARNPNLQKYYSQKSSERYLEIIQKIKFQNNQLIKSLDK